MFIQMSNLIEEYPNILTEEICEDIIEKIQEDPLIQEIPKNNKEWKKTENYLYKNLLSCVSDYKKKRIKNIVLETECPISKELLEGLQAKMGVISFKIIQNTTQVSNYNRSMSRYNLLSFVFYLNKVKNGQLVFKDKDDVDHSSSKNNNVKNRVIEPEVGKLVLFPETPELFYHGESPLDSEVQYIITGQIIVIDDKNM